MKLKKRNPGSFVKGDPRCNRGSEPLPMEHKEIKLLTAVDFAAKFNDLLQKSHTELWAVAQDPRTDILRSYLAKCLIKGKLHGDYYTMDKMLERIVGKVKLAVEHTGENGAPILSAGVDLGKYSDAVLEKIEKQLNLKIGDRNGRTNAGKGKRS